MDRGMGESRVAVIGAGPAGLTAAKALREAGLQPAVFERAGALGGQWNPAGGASGVWPGMRANTSTALTSFSDFPPTPDVSMFASSEQIRRYLERYAARFELDSALRTGCEVTAIAAAAHGWDVTWRHGAKVGHEHFGRVVVATGRFHRPTRPAIPGLEGFAGAGGVQTAYQFRGSEPYRGCSVLVIGNSISGLEIASELARDPQVRVISACRKPRYIVPKLVRGLPTDWRVFTRLGALLARRLTPPELGAAFKAQVLALGGPPQRAGGLPPDEDILVANVGQCQHYLALVAEGRIAPRLGPARVDGTRVWHLDGSSDRVDAIVCATGYELHLPILDPALRRALAVDDQGLDLHEHTFHPDVPSLAFMGQYVQIGPYFPVLELQARWIASVWSGARALPSRARMLDGIARTRGQRLRGELVRFDDNALRLAREAGVAPVLAKRPELARALLVGPLLPMQFRLDGPGALRDAAPRLVETFAELSEDGLADIAPRGDMIYADNPIAAEVALPGGAIWRNVVIPEKAKVAETVAEFRGNYRYNLMDEHVRRFNAEVAQYVQWDDHEVTNNWFHERILDDARYTEKRVALLAARAKRAMFEFTPTRPHPVESERVYRVIHRGPLLDLFLLDMRSYRGPNGENRQPELTDEARVLGEPRRRGGSSGSCSARRPPGR